MKKKANLELHAQNGRQLLQTQLLCRSLGPAGRTVPNASQQLLRRREALETRLERRHRGDTQAPYGTLFRLHLDVETEIEHGVVCSRGMSAGVASDAAAELAVEDFVEKALASAAVRRVGVGAIVSNVELVEFVDQELVILVCVLLMRPS